ncbi:hypothetical protein IWX76_001645 [Pedobacter sp. CAN_A7]
MKKELFLTSCDSYRLIVDRIQVVINAETISYVKNDKNKGKLR